MIKAIFFDFFGVISSEVAPFWFAERYEREDALRLKEEYMMPADRGDVFEEETFNRLALLSGEPAEDIYADFYRRAVVNDDTVKLIERLKKKYKILLLSNAMSDWLKTLLEKNSLMRLFDYTVISADEKTAKPERRIFEIALLRAGVSADEVIFIDDNKRNIDGALRAGIEGIIFTDAKALESELIKRGVL